MFTESPILFPTPIKDRNLRKRTLENIYNFAPKTRVLIDEMEKISDMTHALNVTVAYQNFISNLLTSPDINISPENATYFTKQGVINALFHDIGKLGVVPSGIADSYKIFNFEKEKNPKTFQLDHSSIQVDNRSPEIKALQALHPTIGGYMLKLAGLTNASQTAFSHHELYIDSTSSTPKSSYPRIYGKRDTYPHQDFVNIIIGLIDCAVGMREKRYNRNKLDFETIGNELKSRINKETIKRLKPYFPKSLFSNEEFKEQLTLAIVKSTMLADSEIQTPFNNPIFKPNELSHEKQLELAPNLSYLIAKTWKTYEKDILESYKRFLIKTPFHESRKT